MAQLTLRDVSKRYPSSRGGDVVALNQIDLDVADHEFVVLAGPAASGKSTALRIIAGLEQSSGGEIIIGDRSVKDLPLKERDVAIVFSDDALLPHLTVYENLAFGLRRRNFSDQEVKRRVNETAAALGLEQSLAHKPDALSREHRQRVALGRGIVRQPKVLLLDEPFASLDDTTRAQMRGELARLHQRLESTIIYATRDPVEALTLGDRVVVMDCGSVQQTGTAQAIYDAPANLFVARFFGSPSINILEGVLKQERDSLVFQETNEGTVEVRFAAADRPRAQDFVGKSILLGIRPEDISSQMQRGGGEKTTDGIPAVVDLIEARGAETFVHLQTGAHRLVYRSARAVDRQETGRRLRFQMDASRAHLFDPVSLQRLA